VSWSSDFAARTSFLSKGVIAFDPTGSLFGPKMDGFIPQFRKQDWFKAIRNNDAKTVNEMLKEGFDPNTEEDGHGCCPALHIASCEGCVEVAEVLLEHGVNPNNYRDGGDLGGTPLHNLYLGEVPSVRIAKLLIKFGANVNIRNPYGSTPLHLAAEEWNIDLIRVLIENNANVNEPDGNNRTPLESARWKARKNERSLNPEIEKLLAGT
jgi:ankyrin repeat protein